MSVEAHELVSHEWARWQGHRIQGVFPLGRILGCSEHSGVFLTKSADPHARELAIKLMPASRAAQELQLPRWKRASGLSHPHLLPLLESGACELDGLPYLYVVMEYADQTLAQLLLRRALSVEEARDMLLPLLDALAFLHAQGLVQGQVKPTNVLVVGDQLKLASDTVRRLGEEALVTPSAYDPPKGLGRSHGTADDVWGLGVSLFEALTRRAPPASAGPRSGIVLPADFAPRLRDVVTRCLSPLPQDRPPVTELRDWAGGRAVPAMPVETALPAAPERLPQTQHTVPQRRVDSPQDPEATQPAQRAARSPKRAFVAAMLAAGLILTLGWTVIPALRAHRTGPAAPVAATDELAPLTAGGEFRDTPPPRTDAHVPSPVRSAGDGAEPLALHEEIPVVATSAARTLRGHLEVSVRATVRPDGSVSAAVAERGAPSKYFQRLAVDAARKWTFPAVHAAPPRRVQIQFDFSRDRTLAHAVLPP